MEEIASKKQYCVKHKMYIQESREVKRKFKEKSNPFKKIRKILGREKNTSPFPATGQTLMQLQYKLENGKWVNAEDCSVTSPTKSEQIEISVQRKRKKTGLHFVRSIDLEI